MSIYSIFDSNGKHVMFANSKEYAEFIINQAPVGYFHWKIAPSDDIRVPNQEGLRYVSPEVGYVDQDEEYY
jgi:hypothetical protein